MTSSNKTQIKMYTRAKHTMTLLGTAGAVAQGECQIEEINGMIADRREQIGFLKAQINSLQDKKAEAQAALAGYKQALREKK